jgi:hypothetical protein
MTLDIDVAVERTLDYSMKLETRERIFDLEAALASLPNALHDNVFPLKHSFGDGIYMREIWIPAGVLLTGKIHRHDHPNVLVTGEVMVVTEHAGLERLAAPVAMISKAGTKRALFTITDTHWITFHNVGNERDLDRIEAMLIAPTYADMERPKELVI